VRNLKWARRDSASSNPSFTRLLRVRNLILHLKEAKFWSACKDQGCCQIRETYGLLRRPQGSRLVLQRAGRESRRCSDACSTRLMPQCQEFEDMRNQLTNQPNVSSRFAVITRNSFLSHSSSFVLCSRQRWYRRSGRVASSADPARATW
jgi:hypothetical protein